MASNNMKWFHLACVLAIAVAGCRPGPPSQGDAQAVSDDVVVDAVAIAVPRAELPFTRKPRPAPTVTTASKDTRTRTQAQIDIAACTAADTSLPLDKRWRCGTSVPRPKVFAASASTPIIPPSWTVPDWFVDPQNTSGTASDANACTSSGNACRTWGEIAVHRFGFSGGCPAEYVGQNTTITYLSSHTDNTDPMLWCPIQLNGAWPLIQGTTPTATAAIFTLVAAKNRTAGSNTLLEGSFSAGSIAVGVPIQNTTAAKSSAATIHKTAGGSNWFLTQPLAPLTIPTTANAPTEIDTWATSDTVNVLSYTAVNLVKYAPTQADQNGAGDNYGYLYQLTDFDPQGVGDDNIILMGAVEPIQCLFQRGVSFLTMQGNVASGQAAHDATFVNDYFLGGLFLSATVDEAIVVGGGTNNFTSAFGEAFFDGDYVAGGFGFNFIAGGNFGIGFLYLDANSTASAGSRVAFETGLYSGHVVYGTAAKILTFNDTSRGQMVSGTFTNGWTFPTAVSPGVRLNNSSVGCSSNASSPDVINCAITTTVAHLDVAQGVAGFGGNAFVLGGASVGNF